VTMRSSTVTMMLVLYKPIPLFFYPVLSFLKIMCRYGMDHQNKPKGYDVLVTFYGATLQNLLLSLLYFSSVLICTLLACTGT